MMKWLLGTPFALGASHTSMLRADASAKEGTGNSRRIFNRCSRTAGEGALCAAGALFADSPDMYPAGYEIVLGNMKNIYEIMAMPYNECYRNPSCQRNRSIWGCLAF